MLNFTHTLKIVLQIKLLAINTIILIIESLESSKLYKIVPHVTCITMYIILLDKLYLPNANILLVVEAQLYLSKSIFLFGSHLLIFVERRNYVGHAEAISNPAEYSSECSQHGTELSVVHSFTGGELSLAQPCHSQNILLTS